MVARTFSSIQCGPYESVVEIEASIQNALPSIVLTGLPGDVVKESRERIRACLSALGFQVPSARIVIHLSPASSKKQGSQLDLAMAVAFLGAEGMIKPHLPIDKIGFLGELSIDGRIRGIQNGLPLGHVLVQDRRVDHLIVPMDNVEEFSLLRSIKVIALSNLTELLNWLKSGDLPAPASVPLSLRPRLEMKPDLDLVHGQPLAKRALQIALAGRHHLLLAGPPGVGKTFLANAAPSLLPPLEESEIIELMKSRGFVDAEDPRFFCRPFRSPHHSISAAGLLGGGSGHVVRGEVTLSHGGVLFLDEFPEFRKDALEGLREPLQSGTIDLRRVGAGVSLPARFLLIAAMNPCPCGYFLDTRQRCTCPPARAEAYRRRISGPLCDRLDLCVVMSPPEAIPQPCGITHAQARDSIRKTFELQRRRYPGAMRFNSEAEVNFKSGPFQLGDEAYDWLNNLCGEQSISFRALHKTVRVARTIADLAEAEEIELSHLREAWSLRCRDFSKVY